MREREHLIVGRIGGVYGVRGWLKIDSYTRPEKNITTYSPLLIHVHNHWERLAVEAFQHQGRRRLLKITGIDNSENARRLIHCELGITRGQLPTLTDGTYYWHDLIGLEVVNQDAVRLGKISDIVETGAHDVLVIHDDKQVKTLIPLLMGIFVKHVDLTTHTMQVAWAREA